jgi:hypothetical protein
MPFDIREVLKKTEGYDIDLNTGTVKKKIKAPTQTNVSAEIIAELRLDIVSAKELTLKPLNAELKVESGYLHRVKKDQQELLFSSIIFIAAILFILAVFIQKIRLKYFQFNHKNIDKRRVNIILLAWCFFHFFILVTSHKIFVAPDTYPQEKFWVLADWKSYAALYDLSEFVIYAIIPTMFIFGRRYLRGEKLL